MTMLMNAGIPRNSTDFPEAPASARAAGCCALDRLLGFMLAFPLGGGSMQDRYREIYDAFRWEVPDRFNMAAVCCARWAGDRDRFALYCMGALQAAIEMLLHLYPSACSTGDERGCALMRETIETIEEGRTLTRQYLAVRFAERRRITGRLLLAVRTGESEQKRCLRWRIDNIGSSPAGGPPRYCRQADMCRDLGRLSLERPASPASSGPR